MRLGLPIAKEHMAAANTASFPKNTRSCSTNPIISSHVSIAERRPLSLALACCDCNLLKGPNIASLDPDTGQLVPLFDPRRDRWADHFRLESAMIIGLTPIGRATAFLLEFNDPERVHQRQQLQCKGHYPLTI